MENEISGTNEAQDNQVEIDSWAKAFAALEPKSEETSSTDSNTEGAADGSETAGNTSATGGENVSDQDETINSNESQDSTGGLDTNVGSADVEVSSAFSGMLGVTEESIQQFEEQLNGEIRNRAIDEVVKEFIKRGIKNTNGVLGATLDDDDICKRDSDGVPHFYNPETGREFTGDNPRRQAQEWVDDYNKELARVFNNTCQQYEQHLLKEETPKLELMKFAPKYEKLDDIRRGMFDNVIEDYEVKNSNGEVIGYSCDLDKALALVDRQIAMIQNYAKEHQPQQQQQPTGPVLDMKTSSGAVQAGDDKPPASLAEAMERLQNAQLDKLKKN